MSSIVYRHENNKSFKDKKGVKHLVKESIIDGEKGLSFVLTVKEGDNFHRIHVKEVGKDKFELKEKVNDKETSKELDMKELNNMIKSNKDLAFVKDYVENVRGKQKGGAVNLEQCGGAKKKSKKSKKLMMDSTDPEDVDLDLIGGGKKKSKKGSKKSSKKRSMKGGSKKTSKKGSKKGSKKSSKKRSMKGGSKKTSKKGSKKGSKKRSMK